MHYKRLLIPKLFISAEKNGSYRIGGYKKDDTSSLLEVKDVYLYMGFHFYENDKETQTMKFLSPRKVKNLIFTYRPGAGIGRFYKSLLPTPTYRYYQKTELTPDQLVYLNHIYVQNTANGIREKFQEIFKLNNIW
jgi:hypothetical protein